MSSSRWASWPPLLARTGRRSPPTGRASAHNQSTSKQLTQFNVLTAVVFTTCKQLLFLRRVNSCCIYHVQTAVVQHCIYYVQTAFVFVTNSCSIYHVQIAVVFNTCKQQDSCLVSTLTAAYFTLLFDNSAVGAVDSHRSRIGILQQLHLKFPRLIYFKRFLFAELLLLISSF